MAKHNFFDILKNTIEEIQRNNQSNPREETANPSVFDLLKDKIQDVESKTRANVEHRDGSSSPVSILNLIKSKIEEARTQNQNDRNVPTAPTSIFDQLKQKVQEREQHQHRQVEESINDIIMEYRVDVRNLNQDILRQVQAKYIEANNQLEIQFANYLHNLNQKASGRR